MTVKFRIKTSGSEDPEPPQSRLCVCRTVRSVSDALESKLFRSSHYLERAPVHAETNDEVSFVRRIAKCKSPNARVQVVLFLIKEKPKGKPKRSRHGLQKQPKALESVATRFHYCIIMILITIYYRFRRFFSTLQAFPLPPIGLWQVISKRPDTR